MGIKYIKLKKMIANIHSQNQICPLIFMTIKQFNQSIKLKNLKHNKIFYQKYKAKAIQDSEERDSLVLMVVKID